MTVDGTILIEAKHFQFFYPYEQSLISAEERLYHKNHDTALDARRWTLPLYLYFCIDWKLVSKATMYDLHIKHEAKPLYAIAYLLGY